MSMYQKANEKHLSSFGLAATSREIILDGLPLPDYEPGVAEDVASYRFLGSILIWLDITHSITAGTAPRLVQYHSVIASNSQTQLEDVMACKNWVMLQISRTTALFEQKTQSLQQGHFDCTEFKRTVGNISEEIQRGLTEGSLERFGISEGASGTMAPTMPDTALITHCFAYMASIYLHLVVNGFENLELLDTTISEAIRILKTQVTTQPHLLPALVSPLFIIGSVSGQGDKDLFRNIFSSSPLLDPLMKHRGRILPILEEIWNRRSIPGFTWEDTLELTNDTLLI